MTDLPEDVMRIARQRERQAGADDTPKALLFLAPALLLVGLFLLVPVLMNIAISFTRWERFSGFGEWAGLDNYRRMAAVPYFNEALENTAWWVASSLVFPLAGGLALALALRNIRGQQFFKTLFFLPKVLAPTAVGAIWYYMYTPAGVINTMASSLTGARIGPGYLYDGMTVTPAIVTTFVWQSLGISMVLLLLGLAAIPRDTIEAARVDGASRRQILWHVVLPQLAPTMIVVTILNVAAGFTTFDLLWVMGSDYPGKRSLSLAVYMYFESFSKGAWALGCTVAVVLGATVIGATTLLAYLQSYVEKRVR